MVQELTRSLNHGLWSSIRSLEQFYVNQAMEQVKQSGTDWADMLIEANAGCMEQVEVRQEQASCGRCIGSEQGYFEPHTNGHARNFVSNCLTDIDTG